jgi:hypothetical protein
MNAAVPELYKTALNPDRGGDRGRVLQEALVLKKSLFWKAPECLQ